MEQGRQKMIKVCISIFLLLVFVLSCTSCNSLRNKDLPTKDLPASVAKKLPATPAPSQTFKQADTSTQNSQTDNAKPVKSKKPTITEPVKTPRKYVWYIMVGDTQTTKLKEIDADVKLTLTYWVENEGDFDFVEGLYEGDATLEIEIVKSGLVSAKAGGTVKDGDVSIVFKRGDETGALESLVPHSAFASGILHLAGSGDATAWGGGASMSGQFSGEKDWKYDIYVYEDTKEVLIKLAKFPDVEFKGRLSKNPY